MAVAVIAIKIKAKLVWAWGIASCMGKKSISNNIIMKILMRYIA